jgi:hypothetical protein
MKTHLLLAALFLAGSAAYSADTKASPNTNATAAFSRLKTLVGEWEADTNSGTNSGKAHVSYELIAGGTALLERYTSTTEPAMLTVYHIDGGRLLLTHYCMAGNQPRMQAGPFNPETGELEFQFLDATNLASPADGHMHSVRMRIVDHDHVTADWHFYEKGQPKFTENARYTRVK